MLSSKLRKTAAALLVIANTFSVLCLSACNKTEPDTTVTHETTEAPVKSADEIFAGCDKEYFVPFKDPSRSYCTINEGLSTPLWSQGIGGCYAYSAVSTMQCGYLKTNGELADINPVDIINRIYETVDTRDGKEPQYKKEKYYIQDVSALDLGGDVYRVAGSMCADPLNGYLISDASVFGSYNVAIKGTNEISEDDIKKIIRKYGAISLGIHYSRDCTYTGGYYTQNHPDNVNDMNHLATIVGWDDDFPADAFKIPASRNGAWLVQNSFGDFWGNCGFYWISYDTAIPEFYNCSVTKEYSSAISYGRYPEKTVLSQDVIEKVTDNDSTSDIPPEEISKAQEVAAATYYEHKGKIGAIGLWTTVPNQPYTVEILDGKFGKVLASKSGTFEYLGYHTVKLDEPLSVKKFTVVIKVAGELFFEGEPCNKDMNTLVRRVPGHYEAKTEPGRSFVKAGEDWVDVTDPSLKTRLGVDKLPYDFVNTTFSVTPGDPCITVLFI